MRLLSLLLALFHCTGAGAQIGLHPPAVDWQQITTDEGKVIYPRGYETRAQRIANLMAAMRANHNETVGEKHFSFDMVLQTPNTQINGYVGLAPFRSELFLTPPQQPNILSNSDWADLLTIHEFRHVQQNSNERRGLTKIASWLTGQLSWAGLSSLATPNWYSEGDAVVMETALTQSGRGRTPAFSATLRSILDEDVKYSYQRSRNNSLKRLIPDHYRYGYNTITYARETYGNDTWTDVLHQGAAYRGIFYPFSRALKRKTGLNTRKMYRAALEDLSDRQAADLAERPAFVEGTSVGPEKKAVTNYEYPATDGQGRLLALRSGFKETPDLVAINLNDNRETKVVPIGIQREAYVDVRGEWVAWMENRNNLRYTNQGFSDVFVFNLNSGEKRRLSVRQKYFSPAVSADGTKVVAVEEDVFEGTLGLVILSMGGEVLQRIPVEATTLALPKFSPDGSTVYCYERHADGLAIVAIELASGDKSVLKEASYEPLGNLQVAGNGTIIYSNGRDGIDNVYQLDPVTSGIRQLTNVRIGAEFPYLTDDGELYYTEATPVGLRLRKLSASTTDNSGRFPELPGGLLPAGPNVYERPAALADELFDLTAEVPNRTYESKDIHDNLSGLRVHSWSIVGSGVQPGIGVVASNALNTLAVAVTGQYNINERTPQVGFLVNYGGLFPVLSAGLQFAERDYEFTTIRDSSVSLNSRRLNQTALNLGASVPLNWTAGEFFFGILPAVDVSRIVLGETNFDLLPANFTSAGTGLSFQAIKRRARQQVQSRLGISAQLRYDQTISDADLGQRFRLLSEVYLPGIGKTHGLRLEFDYQSEDNLRPYQYIDGFKYSRGYDVNFVDDAFRFGVNYELPLFHPDFGVAGIWYLRRIRLNAFYDYGRYNYFALEEEINSAGAEIYFDQVWCNTGPGSFGFQFAYLLNDDFQGNRQGNVNFRLVAGQRF